MSARDAAWATYWLARYSLGLDAGLDAVFERIVSRLEGQPEAELDRRVRAWFADAVAHRLRPGARDALDAHRAEGSRLVVATTSSAYAAGAARRSFGLDDQISSVFEVRGGRFTGRVAAPALGAHKADRVQEYAARHGVDLADATFYTDSISDVALLRLVGRPVAVNPDRALLREARRAGWEVVDWGRA